MFTTSAVNYNSGHEMSVRSKTQYNTCKHLMIRLKLTAVIQL